MQKTKEKASILWLLSKAYNKKIPKDLREPYYKNAQNEQVLKPQISVGLSSCELYCMALSNIYEDQSFADLDHIGVIHLLIKKGIHIVEPTDIDLNETALRQNSPIRMSAHMAVLDAIMNLFSKDVLIPEKIVEVVSRFAPIDAEEVPLDLEEVALFWLNKSSERYRQVIEDELNSNVADSITYIPCLPFIQDITELSTGCSLVALLSFYCPDYLNWREVCLKEQELMTQDDCIKNMETVQYFCAKYLPYDICFIELDSLLRIKNQMRINLLTFIADLLYLFEVKPAYCVRQPEYEYDDEDDVDELDYDFKENERINHNNNLTSTKKKLDNQVHHSELTISAQVNRVRSQQHTSWTTENDEDEDNLNEEIRNQQKRLRNYLHQQQAQHPSANEFYLNDTDTRQSNHRRFSSNRQLNNDLQSLNLNKDSSSENEFYLAKKTPLMNKNNHQPLINSDGSESSSTLSFAKLSKIKNNSIPHNLNEVDSPSINVVYSSDQDDRPNKLAHKHSHNKSSKRNSTIYRSNDRFEMNGADACSEQDEADIANQILQIHMKLEEKKKQIEMEKQQVDAYYKTQKRDISNEAFLKALKIEKQNQMSNSIDCNDVSAYEIKEGIDSLRKNLPAQLKSEQYYSDVKSSIDILSSSVLDLEKDLTEYEETKMLTKQQKENLDRLIDQQHQLEQIRSSNSQLMMQNDDCDNESKFYLHTDKPNQIDNKLTQLLNNNFNANKLHSSYASSNNFANELSMNDSQIFEQQLLNSNSRRANLQSNNRIDLVESNEIDNNHEKGFFVPLEPNGNNQKKPRSKPPVLNNQARRFSKDEIDRGISQQSLEDNLEKPDAVGFVIGYDLVSPDPKSEFAKAKKKEFIMNQSMKRKAEQEEKMRILKDELNKKSENERKKREQIEKRKEENRLRKEAILEQHRLRKLAEQTEKDAGTLGKLMESSKAATLRNRHQNLSSLNRARPKSIHISSNVASSTAGASIVQSSIADQKATTNFSSLDLRNNASSKLVGDHLDSALIHYPSSVMSNFHSSPFANSLRPQSSMSSHSTAMKKLYNMGASSSKYNMPSLPSFMLGNNRLHKGSGSSDGVSEIGSTYSEYTGPKLYVKPTQKSNRGIIVNAINVVLAGAVNLPTKKKVLEEINKNDSKHFLILFRGSGMQFRAIYTYNPDVEEVVKLHGTGPKLINNEMIEKFYKYNSGGKNFNEVHTKHLTVTIDAITIHSALWSGKKVPSKKDLLI